MEARIQAIYCARTLTSPAPSRASARSNVQSVVDAHCSLGFAKLHLSKVPMTAVGVLDDRVLPFYEEHEHPVTIFA